MAFSINTVLRKPKLLFHKVEKPEDSGSLRGSHPRKDGQLLRLHTFEEIPNWHQDNPYVRTGYRPVSNSVQSCVFSLSYLHNETLNIYTHLLPALGLALLLPTLQLKIFEVHPSASFKDRLILALAPTTAVVTFSLSAIYHTLMNHSHAVSAFCLLLDFVGILSLILSSFISGIYVGFYCDPLLQKTYWGMINVLITISALLVLHPKLQGPSWRPHRTTAFVLTALSGFTPIGHGMIRYGWEDMFNRSGLPWWLAEGLWYGLGVVFFASRIPEKLAWAKYDLVGSSHQLFHVCVVFGAACHCWGVWKSWEANVRSLRC
jgi:adiponectin receptor